MNAMKASRRGFATDSTASAAAKRGGHFELTGPGQQCLPVELPNGLGWAFWTAHDYYHPEREPGELLFPGRELSPTDDVPRLMRLTGLTEYDVCDWLRDELGISGPFYDLVMDDDE